MVQGAISFGNPFGEGIFRLEIFPEEEGPADDTRMDFVAFAKLVFLLGIPGWIIEALITGLIVAYVRRFRPDLVKSGE